MIWLISIRMAFFHRTMDRDKPSYRQNHYRAHWQPFWAYLGLFLCSLLMIFSGWSAIYDLIVRSQGVKTRDSIVDLVAAYIGVSTVATKHLNGQLIAFQPALFFSIFAYYKWRYRTHFRGLDELSDVWFPTNVPDEDSLPPKNGPSGSKNRFYNFLSWIK